MQTTQIDTTTARSTLWAAARRCAEDEFTDTVQSCWQRLADPSISLAQFVNAVALVRRRLAWDVELNAPCDTGANNAKRMLAESCPYPSPLARQAAAEGKRRNLLDLADRITLAVDQHHRSLANLEVELSIAKKSRNQLSGDKCPGIKSSIQTVGRSLSDLESRQQAITVKIAAVDVALAGIEIEKLQP